MSVLRNLRSKIREIYRTAVPHLLYWPYVLRHRLGRRCSLRRLHLGCGANRFDGWINADIAPGSELIVFIEKRLPFPNESLDRIYCEHVMEHVPYSTALKFLKRAKPKLALDGIIRVAVPDLEDIVAGYHLKDWRTRFDWVQWPDYAFLKTRAEMINIAFRWWGHQHLYDREELERLFRDAGYTQVSFQSFGESGHEDLRNLETRKDSRLIIEAKP